MPEKREDFERIDMLSTLEHILKTNPSLARSFPFHAEEPRRNFSRPRQKGVDLKATLDGNNNADS